MADFSQALKPQYDGSTILEAERRRSNISVDELSNHLLSRNDFLRRQERITRILQNEPLFSKKQQLNLSRPDRYHLGLARAKALRRLTKKHGWDLEDFKMAEYLTDEMSPYHLQFSMFATTMREQASEEQLRLWWPRIASYEILGCYAQSELGHGSNVRGLECQARYDARTREFVVHSPTLTASKWWNGSMGRTATHALVVAQLLTPDPSDASKLIARGPHPLIVRIRHEKTHEPLNGVIVGDIGPKYGYASMDNGYLLFNQFRVPHSALLSKYYKVDPETGNYSRHGHPQVVYGTLTNVRANIIMHARLILARAVTIAIRYTSIRRQFRDRDASSESAAEMTVLDYPTVQIRLLPLLATTFALHYTGEAIYTLYNQTRDKIEKGDFSSLAEMHGVSSGLKSICTRYAADGIEICRRSMGGHGFGGGSGLVGINSDYLSKPTVEGDNWMITQQAASFLIKKMTAAAKDSEFRARDRTDELFSWYLNGTRPFVKITQGTKISNEAIVTAFRWRAAELSHQAFKARVVQKRSWTSLLIQLHRLSDAYSEMILVENFFRALETLALSVELIKTLNLCFQLYSLNTMDASARSFASTGATDEGSLDALPDLILDIMSKLRPHAVRLVDSWKMPDYLLNSALGRFDGKVYETLYDMAHRQNPLNKTTFNPRWQDEEIVMGSGDAGHILSKL